MSFQNSIKKSLNPLKSWAFSETRRTTNFNLLLQGRMASWHVRSQEVISALQDVEFKVSSQWGADGIIDWLIERANIPPAARSFVEFGVGEYREANTRFLLQNRNWRGLIMDGGDAMIDLIRQDALDGAYQLQARPAFITRENINELISNAGFSGEIGLLSIDIDGNDYWVWEAIQVVQPILVVCEYNAVFGDIHPISTPYDPAFYRTEAHYSNLYFGASISALRSLATRLGYRFVGTTTMANDAFFVREDYARRFVDHSLKNIVALPSHARESNDRSRQLNYISGLDRIQHISALPVVNTETGKTVILKDLGQFYSDEWLALMTGAPAK